MELEQLKKVAILQSNYIPWRGYFDLVNSVDEFILFDDMQYTKRDWRNRNKIKTPQGLKWLTVPVKVKGKYNQKIKDTVVDDNEWQHTHLRTLQQYYKKSRFYDDIMLWIEPLYQQNYQYLSELNSTFLHKICRYLGIQTRITSSTEYDLVDGKTERLVNICQQVGATEYLSGPSAKNYVDPELFASQDITLTWFDYSGYSPYPQLWGEFAPDVSILDLLFNCGPNSKDYLSKNCLKSLKSEF